MKPLRDIVFVQRDEPEEKEGSIVIPDQARKKATRCRVMYAGPGDYDDKGKRKPMTVKVGDIIHINTWVGEEVEVDGEMMYALHDDEIEAIEA